MPNSKRVVIQAAVDTHSGLGQLFCEIFSGLMRRGIDVAVRPIQTEEKFTAIPYIIKEKFVYAPQEEEWELLIISLASRLYPTPGKKTAYFCMWETDALGREQMKVLSRAHALIVPSTWQKDCFERAGLLMPIYVVPLGTSPEIFSYRAMDVDSKCTFMTAGRILDPRRERKGLATIMSAFTKAFQDRTDVKLSIKTFPDEPMEVNKDLPANIEVIRSIWAWDVILHWLMNGTAFVHAGQEGWGLMQNQAMAVGRPLIGPIWGAMADYVTPGNSYPVMYKLEDAGWVYRSISGGKWPVMDEEDLSREMRRVYFDREEALDKGVRASEGVAHLTWDNTVARLLEVFDTLGML